MILSRKQYGHVIRIKIAKLNKEVGFPLTNRINEEIGVRYFTSRMEK